MLSCQNVPLDEPVPLSIAAAAGAELTVDVAGFAEPLAPGPCSDIPQKPRVERRARVSMPSGIQLFLPMQLRWGCFDVTCGARQTCVQGACISDDVDAASLVAYDESLTSGAASHCLATKLCFDRRAPALLVDTERCEYELPSDVPTDKGLNVELVQDTLAREVLDVDDPVEGFTLDPEAPSKLTLSPALCQRVRDRKISAVSVGIGCPSKTVLNPMCTRADKVGDGRPTEPPGLCTQPARLAPSPSAIYFLFDRSASMRALFGYAASLPRGPGAPPPFQDAVRTMLSSPALETSAIAFQPLPAAPGACGDPNRTEPPALPFLPARGAADAMMQKLADPSFFLSSNPPLRLDTALGDSALEAFARAPENTAARRMAIIGNRDLWTSCGSSITPADRSYHALTERNIRTNVLLLGAPPGTDQGGRDPYVDGTAIARAGYGLFFEASDTRAAASALARIVLEASSCMYELPSSLERTNLAQTKLAYFHGIDGKRVDLDYNAECSERKPIAEGWGLEGSRVRLCGKACWDLRGLQETALLYAIDHGAPPPDVPVRWVQPCR